MRSVKSTALVACMTTLLIVCSWLSIPLPIPVTLQTFGLFLLGGLLPTRKRLATVAVYLALGAIGLPVFASFQGGLGTLFGPTGGFLLGFLPAVLMMGLGQTGTRHPIKVALPLLAGLLILYTTGTLWYTLVFAQSSGGILTALGLCVVPHLLPDLAKLTVAVPLILKLRPLLTRLGEK